MNMMSQNSELCVQHAGFGETIVPTVDKMAVSTLCSPYGYTVTLIRMLNACPCALELHTSLVGGDFGHSYTQPS